MLRRLVTVPALAMSGFRAIVAENGAAGLEAFSMAPDEIRLILADVMMPCMGGLEMAEQIRAIRPGARNGDAGKPAAL